jgi:hypothetical protein
MKKNAPKGKGTAAPEEIPPKMIIPDPVVLT